MVNKRLSIYIDAPLFGYGYIKKCKCAPYTTSRILCRGLPEGWNLNPFTLAGPVGIEPTIFALTVRCCASQLQAMAPEVTGFSSGLFHIRLPDNRLVGSM